MRLEPNRTSAAFTLLCYSREVTVMATNAIKRRLSRSEAADQLSQLARELMTAGYLSGAKRNCSQLLIC